MCKKERLITKLKNKVEVKANNVKWGVWEVIKETFKKTEAAIGGVL